MKLKADVAILDILGHLIIWLLLSLVTLGIAMFFFLTRSRSLLSIEPQ
ncbi:hypothetical protein P7F88_03335 [Vibrio hannami]|nr:DUF6693 family protein [Vibrio hannami]MDG3085184.1 hypothetical protein [Vibrio hannami]